jgi:hypothetical protein
MDEQKINFCLSKCGDGYCGYMKIGPDGVRDGYPCVEYVCTFCEKLDPSEPDEAERYCKFCKGESDEI